MKNKKKTSVSLCKNWVRLPVRRLTVKRLPKYIYKKKKKQNKSGWGKVNKSTVTVTHYRLRKQFFFYFISLLWNILSSVSFIFIKFLIYLIKLDFSLLRRAVFYFIYFFRCMNRRSCSWCWRNMSHIAISYGAELNEALSDIGTMHCNGRTAFCGRFAQCLDNWLSNMRQGVATYIVFKNCVNWPFSCNYILLGAN